MSRAHVALLGLLVGCRTPQAVPPPPKPTEVTTNKAVALGQGDVVEVKVFQEADLSGIYRLSNEGTINFPFCTGLLLQGLAPSEAAAVIVGCLKPRYLKNPQVSVTQREYNSKKIFVLGEVQKPGTFAFESGMTIVQVITLSGGFTKLSSRNAVTVTRIVDGAETHLKISVEDIAVGRAPNVLVLPGDIVYVPESFF
jgi:polysaccharide export outer membrane protein